MLNSSNLKEYKKIENELKKEFICIPPYQCINGSFLYNCSKIEQNELTTYIFSTIMLPWQRAYQMQYRFEKCKIFTDYLLLIESATLSAFEGNYVCSYLSLLPVVESILRKSAGKMTGRDGFKDYIAEFKTYCQTQNKPFSDIREEIFNSYYNHLDFILSKVFNLSFNDYDSRSYNEIFNRNLTLHKLDGINDKDATRKNVIRILLLLDLISEIHLLSDLKLYWTNIFDADYDSSERFEKRYKTYIDFCLKQPVYDIVCKLK